MIPMLITILAVVLLIQGCEKKFSNKKDSYVFPSSINAGQMEGDSILYQPLDTTIIIESPSSGTSYESIDVNHDDINDFAFSIYGVISPGSRRFTGKIEPLNGNSIVVSDSNNNWIDTFPKNKRIDDLLKWSDAKSLLFYRIYDENWLDESGLWKSVNDKYVGIRIINEGNTFYGWINLRTELYYNVAYKIYIESFAITKPVLNN